jgi:hypothetical protein
VRHLVHVSGPMDRGIDTARGQLYAVTAASHTS